MIDQRLQRPDQPRRSPLIWLTCGCAGGLLLLSVACASALLLFPTALPDLALRVVGFQPQGETETLFVDVPVAPTVVLENPTTPDQVTIQLGGFGETAFSNTPRLYEFTIGAGAGGQQTAVATFTEAGLNELCRQRTTICSPTSTDPRFRNAQIDLRPGGALVYVDVTVPQLGQTLRPAVVLRWDAPSRRVIYAGVDLNGILYSTPPVTLDIDFAGAVVDLEREINNTIQGLALSAGGGVYRLHDAQITHDTLTLILR